MALFGNGAIGGPIPMHEVDFEVERGPREETTDAMATTLLIACARKLERMGLATEVEVGRWSISVRAEPTLREMGERGDIIKTMHRAVEREGFGRSTARFPLCHVPREDQRADRRAGAVKGPWRRRMGERGETPGPAHLRRCHAGRRRGLVLRPPAGIGAMSLVCLQAGGRTGASPSRPQPLRGSACRADKPDWECESTPMPTRGR